MARLIIKTATGPQEIKPDQAGKSHWICMCGLSKNQPFCDKSHVQTQNEEGKTFIYKDDGSREEVELGCNEGHCCCGKDD